MKTFSAVYKGDRVVELLEDIDLPKDIEVLVVIPEQEDEKELCSQLRNAAEVVFAKLWDNKEDEVWNEYISNCSPQALGFRASCRED
jgi:hypothetical protein